jgi:hypothetical protein
MENLFLKQEDPGFDIKELLPIFSYVTFSLTTLLIIFVSWKTKCRIDKAGQLSLCIYVFTAGVTSFKYIHDDDLPLVLGIIFSLLSNTLIWLALYYFTFEMKLIECALESGTIEEVQKNVMKTQWQKWTVIGILLLIFGPLYSFAKIVKVYYDEFFYDYENVFFALELITRTIKLILDIIVFYLMYRLVWVFLKIKIALMKRKGQR